MLPAVLLPGGGSTRCLGAVDGCAVWVGGCRQGAAPPTATPLARLTVRFCSPEATAGRVVLADDPLSAITRDELAPPVSVPLLWLIALLTVSVCVLRDSAPAVRVIASLTVRLPFRATLALLLMVNWWTLDGKPLPVSCATTPW